MWTEWHQYNNSFLYREVYSHVQSTFLFYLGCLFFYSFIHHREHFYSFLSIIISWWCFCEHFKKKSVSRGRSVTLHRAWVRYDIKWHSVTEHMEKHFKMKNYELKVKISRADRLTLAPTSDCWTALTKRKLTSRLPLSSVWKCVEIYFTDQCARSHSPIRFI